MFARFFSFGQSAAAQEAVPVAPRAPEETAEEQDEHDDADKTSHKGSVTSNVTDSRHSAHTANTNGQISAFTAPPRYRNSGVFVHGTAFQNFQSIMEHGLRASKKLEIHMIDELRADGRVPGLQSPPEMLIFIDENKARSENMEFEYDGDHGTWKTSGINGVIRPWFFQKVLDWRKGPGRGTVLFQSKEDPMIRANAMKAGRRPRYLVHATYWENVAGILNEGIVPVKNPTSSLRRPLKSLLQGAENQVYTVSMSKPNACLDFEPASRRQEPEDSREPERTEQPDHSPSAWDWGAADVVGLDRPPDAYFVIDTKRAEELNIPLSLVQSGDREDTIYVEGPVPRELLVRAVPTAPIELPESLKATIMDPKSFDEVPIIDLSKDEETVIRQLRYACEVVGFMQVVGHGISQELQERHMQVQKRFFALPQEVKDRIRLSDESPVRGYFGPGGEDLDSVLLEQVDTAQGEKIKTQTRQDNKEALDLNGAPWARPTGGWIAEIFGMPSQFPEEEELPDLKKTLEEYSEAMFALGKRMLSLMAAVLGKPRDHFEQFLTNPVATHRLLHYWPITDYSRQIGVGEHTDYGLLTILKQDNVGGLQVLNYKDSKWVHACPLEDAYVINLGDMMGRWTGHRFKSTIHRVVNTSLNERFSTPYFLEPNMDTVIRYGELTGEMPQGEDKETGTAESILERFYRASGQLKVRGFSKPPAGES